MDDVSEAWLPINRFLPPNREARGADSVDFVACYPTRHSPATFIHMRRALIRGNNELRVARPRHFAVPPRRTRRRASLLPQEVAAADVESICNACPGTRTHGPRMRYVPLWPTRTLWSCLRSTHRHPNGLRKIGGARPDRDLSVPSDSHDWRRLLRARRHNRVDTRFSRVDPEVAWRLSDGRPDPVHRQGEEGS